MASKFNNKKYLIIILLALSFNVYSFNLTNVFTDIISSKAGSKAIDDSEGKDLEKFKDNKQCTFNAPWGEPRIKDTEINKHSLWICKSKFFVQFDTKTKIPLWSSEILEKTNLNKTPEIDTFKFLPDILLPNKFQLDPEDFLNSPYFPVPLSATRNMVINNTINTTNDIEVLKNANLKAIEESKQFSNIVPMVYNNLANTIWLDLENQIRIWAWQKDIIYVTTGVIYLNGQYNGKLKKSGSLIPTHFYKTLVHPYTYGAISFIIPNKEILTNKTKKINDQKNIYKCNGGPCTIYDFTTTINEVEKITNIEFYPNLSPFYAVQVKQNINELFKIKK